MEKFLTGERKEKYVNTVYKNADLKQFAKGDMIVREGDTGEFLYVVLKGRVKVLKVMQGVRKVVLATLGQGDLFGEIAFLSSVPRTASVVAIEPTTVMALDEKNFSALDPDLRLLFYRYMSAAAVYRIKEMENQEKKHEYKSRQFVTRVFLSLKQRSGELKESEIINGIIRKIPRLPVFAVTLSTKLFEGHISPGEVVDELKQDPPLVGTILKTINSSYYALGSQVSDLNYAIMFLGYNEVARIVVAEGVKRTMPDTPQFKEMYNHSLIISYLAAMISMRLNVSKASEIATISLLHEFGELVTLLLKTHNQKMGGLFDLVDTEQMGSMLLKSWHLPEIIWKTVEYQSYPGYAPPEKIPPDIRENVTLLYLSHLCYKYLQGRKEEYLPMIYYYDHLASLNLKVVPLSVFVNKTMIPFLEQRRKTLPVIVHDLLRRYEKSEGESGHWRERFVDLPDINHGHVKV